MKRIYYFALVFFLSSCATMMQHPMKVSDARLGAKTNFYENFSDLPEPQEKVVAAVYKFRDQTGQYKATETGASWSTAVTQGATSILVEAMEESGWFVPIEREGLSNLLNERKIIRSSRMQYLAPEESNQVVLPPLLFAGVILEGGIISFDSNIRTGGAGLRYFGAGGSGQYREDRVTIYLRAVSTSNGRILKTIYTSKTVLSQKLDIGIFRYVKFKRLLEAETGYTYNEPSEIAVKEAIEKALYSLVIEGIQENLWALKDSSDKNLPLFSRYNEEKALNATTDYLGFSENYKRKFYSVGADIGTNYFEGDYPGSDYTGFGNISLGFNQDKKVSFVLNIGSGNLGGGQYFSSKINYSDLNLNYRFLHNNSYSPYLILGSGVISVPKNKFYEVDFSKKPYPYLNFGIGYEHNLFNNIDLNVSITNKLLLNDTFDSVNQGKYSDYYWGISFGMRYYLTIGRKGLRLPFKKDHSSNDAID